MAILQIQILAVGLRFMNCVFRLTLVHEYSDNYAGDNST